MIKFDLAIELGTENTVILRKGEGVVLKEPSLVAIKSVGKKKSFEGVGVDAKNFMTNNHTDINVFEPVVESVVINKQLAIIMLKEFLKKIDELKPAKLKVLFVVPVGLTDKEKNRLLSLGYALNFHTVALLPSSIAGIAGMEIEPNDPNSYMIATLGAGVSDISIVSKSEIVRGASVTVAGKSLSFAINNYLREEHSIIVGEIVNENILKNLVSLLIRDTNEIMIEGLDSDTRNNKTVKITANELLPIVDHYFSKIVEIIEALIGLSSSEVIADISKFGIYICGGLSQIVGLENYLRTHLKYPIFIDSDPAMTTIYGTGKLIDNPSELQRILENLK